MGISERNNSRIVVLKGDPSEQHDESSTTYQQTIRHSQGLSTGELQGLSVG